MTDSIDPVVTRCAPGQRTPRDQIRMRDRPVCYSMESRGLSGQTTLNENAQRKREDVMSVAMAQPHRIGVSPFPDDAWMATALGRFCRAHWRDKDTQRDYWGHGERYAQLVDAERIARGDPPRQCAEVQTAGSPLTLEEARERRAEADGRLRDAEDEMREVDAQAVAAVRTLAWEELDIPARLHGRAYNALWKLSVHFARIDSQRRK